MTTYDLVVRNDAAQGLSFAVFATLPASGRALPLAWATGNVPPGAGDPLHWSTDWSFVAATGPLQPGMDFSPAATLPADPTAPGGSGALVSAGRGSLQLGPVGGSGDGRTLTMRTDPGVPASAYVVAGIALDGRAATVAGTMPGLMQTFTLAPTFAVAAGVFMPGMVVDLDEVSGVQPLDFGGGTALTAAWGADGRWTVTPGVGSGPAVQPSAGG